MKVLTIGHATLDLFFKLPDAHVHEVDLPTAELCLPFPEKIMIRELKTSLGGNAPNVGAGLIKLGHQAALLAEVGEGFLGETTLKMLTEAGFDLSYVKRGLGSDLSVILTYGGERTILSHHPKERVWGFNLDGVQADAVYLSSLGTPKFQHQHEEIVDWLNTQHLAPNTQPRLFYNPGKDELDAGIDGLPILKNTHVLYINKQEAARLLGEQIDDEDTSTETIQHLTSSIYHSGPSIIIITDGENGSYGYNGDNFHHQPAFSCELIERTGAGDAFASGSMAAFLEGEDLPTALRWGTVQACGVIGQTGATKGLLTKEEINVILGQHE